MQLENLTKTQLVLLALLISFVTSIATGIVTVSLMEEAPEPIVQTINRVVERTVEKIVPQEAPKNTSPQKVVEKETTVVVREEDLITKTIEQNVKNLVRIFREETFEVEPEPQLSLNEFSEIASSTTGDSANAPQIVSTPMPIKKTRMASAGLGIVVTKEGFIAASAATANSSDKLAATFATGETVPLEKVFVSPKDSPIAILRPATKDGAVTRFVYSGVKFADARSLKLGQTLIALTGLARDKVAMGIVASIIGVGDAEEELTTGTDSGVSEGIAAITSTIPDSDILAGTPLFNIFGELVAVAANTGKKRHILITANLVDQAISAAARPASTP